MQLIVKYTILPVVPFKVTGYGPCIKPAEMIDLP